MSGWHTRLEHAASTTGLARHLLSLNYTFSHYSILETQTQMEKKATLLAAQSEKPTNGICRWLDAVLSLRHGCSFKSTNGVATLTWISETRSPQASERRIPVSLIKLINQRASSSRFWHSSCTRWSAPVGIGFLRCFAPSSGMNVPLKTLVTVSPFSLIAKLTIYLTEENTRLTDEDDMPRANK